MLHIKTIYTGTAAVMARGAGATTAAMREWIKIAYARTLLHWHEEMKPKHFQESATAEYGYRARQPEYVESKRRSEGHTRPLVHSGESERETEQFVIRVTGKGGALSMSPGKLAFNTRRGRVDKRKELTTVTQAETETLAGVFARSMDMQIRGHSDQLIREF